MGLWFVQQLFIRQVLQGWCTFNKSASTDLYCSIAACYPMYIICDQVWQKPVLLSLSAVLIFHHKHKGIWINYKFHIRYKLPSKTAQLKKVCGHQKGRYEIDVKYKVAAKKWLKGRLMGKILITTIQENLCCLFHISHIFSNSLLNAARFFYSWIRFHFFCDCILCITSILPSLIAVICPFLSQLMDT